MGLVDTANPAVMQQLKNKISPDYDDTDVELLEKRYTPEQLEALRLGESVVSTDDLVNQGRMRNDPYRMNYIEDFSRIQPIVDKRQKTGRPVDTSSGWMTPDEFGDDFIRAAQEISGDAVNPADKVDVSKAYRLFQEMRNKLADKPEGGELTGAEMNEAMSRVYGPLTRSEEDQGIMAPEKELEMKDRIKAQLTKLGLDVPRNLDDADYDKLPAEMDTSTLTYNYLVERNSMTGFDGGDTALAPALPDKVPGVAGLFKVQMDAEDAALDPEGTYQELKSQTGLSIREIIKLFERHTKILVRRHVSNQTRLGKIRSTYVLAISGNEDGWLGMGEAKSTEAETATNKAKLAAIRNMQPIRRYENRTVYGNVEAKVGATIVQLLSRPPGMC